MAIQLEPETRYDMPVAFGPSVAAPVTGGYTVRSASVSFVTEAEAVADLLPRWCRPTSDPVISLTYQQCLGMDWMGDRDYNIFSVYVSVETVGLKQSRVAPYGVVIWENDCAPIISGREYMGTPKIFGQIPGASIPNGEARLEVGEYGTNLITIELEGMHPASDDELGALRRAGEEICRLHWKYIPGLNGEVADADYPVAMYTAANYTEMWKGVGVVKFNTPSEADAPFSARIVAALSSLPRIRTKPSVMTVARDVQMYRDRTQRLR